MAKYQVRPGDHIKLSGTATAHGAPVTHPLGFNANSTHPDHSPVLGERPKSGSDVVELDDDVAAGLHAGNPGVLIPVDGAGRKVLGLEAPEKPAEKAQAKK